MTDHDDHIDRYTVTIADGHRDYCPTCDREQPLWAGVTNGGEEVFCCGHCQRVIRRRHAQPDNEPLK